MHPSTSVSRGLWATSLLAVCFSSSFVHGQAPVVPVDVCQVIQGSIAPVQRFVGTIVPDRRATVGSAVDGRVVLFPRNEGDRVEAGGTLAQLLTATIQLDIKAAEAELRLRNESLRQLRNGSLPEDIEQSRARAEAAKALLEYAETRHRRAQDLVNKGNAISRNEYDEALSLFVSARETLTELRAAYKVAVDGPREELIAQAEAEVEIQEAVVEKLRDQLQKHTIISRFAGYVVTEHTEEGAWVNRGDPVAEVVSLDQVDVLVNIPEAHIGHLSTSDEFQIPVHVPAVSAKAFPGRIVHIVPQADIRSRTFPVKIQITNQLEHGQPLLKSGMLARAELMIGNPHEGLLVPKDALTLGRGAPVVYVFKPNQTPDPTGPRQAGVVTPVPVQLGPEQGPLVEVTSGLKEGDLIVVLGNERLRPNQEVVVRNVIDPLTVGD